MKYRDKHKAVFICSLRLEKIITNRTYVYKSQHAKHGLGYRDLAYHKSQRHDHWNPTKNIV